VHGSRLMVHGSGLMAYLWCMVHDSWLMVKTLLVNGEEKCSKIWKFQSLIVSLPPNKSSYDYNSKISAYC